MIGFLQKHYCEKITLSDIATAGKVCQSNCCAIFNEYLHQTPIQYLIGYRLNKSADY
jgi:AraC-like DNA-binding protein